MLPACCLNVSSVLVDQDRFQVSNDCSPWIIPSNLCGVGMIGFLKCYFIALYAWRELMKTIVVVIFEESGPSGVSAIPGGANPGHAVVHRSVEDLWFTESVNGCAVARARPSSNVRKQYKINTFCSHPVHDAVQVVVIERRKGNGYSSPRRERGHIWLQEPAHYRSPRLAPRSRSLQYSP